MKKIVVILAIVAVVAAGVRAAYFAYRDLRSHASSAEAHLRAAESDLRAMVDGRDFNRITSARDEFSAARQDFEHISAQIEVLGPLHGVAEALPWIGGQAKAIRKLMRAGAYASRAGEEASLAVEDIVQVGKQGQGAGNLELILQAVPQATQHLSAALEALYSARDEYEDLSPEGLHPTLQKALTELQSKAPPQQALLQGALEALDHLPQMIGQGGDKTYLVLVQDAGELRPTGGFIGNYGVIRFHEGKMAAVTFNDSYNVDRPYYRSGKAPPPVGMFARYFPESTWWALRDSNIWPDFERSAQQAARFAVAEGVAERVDGVIGITDDIVQPMMKVVGPITIPDYGETVDQSDVLDRIRFYQNNQPSDEVIRKLGDKVSQNRKLFTSMVLGAIIQRVNNLDLAGLIGLGLSLQDSVKNKGLQLYFAEPELQKLVETYDLAGEIKAATGDYLWVVDMNLTPSKDNLYVKPSIKYSVSISDTGGAISELELSYDYTARQGERYTGTVKRPYHGNYVRVYVPPGSKLLGEEGTEEPVETFCEKGKTVFGNFITMYPGTVRTVKLRYWQPLKIWTTQGKASYDLLVQKQAGNDVDSFESTVRLPQGSSIDAPGVFKVEGTALWYKGPLRSDIRLSASFIPPSE